MNKFPKNKECSTRVTSKPFCDCVECTSKNCPDIMNLVSISLKESTCDPNAGTQKKRSAKKCKTEMKPVSTDSQTNNITLPTFANENRGNSDCVCGSVARALQFDIRNINLGTSEHKNGQCSKDNK